MVWMFVGSYFCFGTIVLSLAEMSSMYAHIVCSQPQGLSWLTLFAGHPQQADSTTGLPSSLLSVCRNRYRTCLAGWLPSRGNAALAQACSSLAPRSRA